MRRLSAERRMPDPAAEGRRAAPDIDRDVEDVAGTHAHQLALRVRRS